MAWQGRAARPLPGMALIAGTSSQARLAHSCPHPPTVQQSSDSLMKGLKALGSAQEEAYTSMPSRWATRATALLLT